MTAPEHVDGCPSCVSVYQPPTKTTQDGSGAVCTYRCAGCGHEWQTSWAVQDDQTETQTDARIEPMAGRVARPTTPLKENHMSTTAETPYPETEALIAVMNGNDDDACELLERFYRSELRKLTAAAERLAKLARQVEGR